jgi:hypothetical protein
LTEGEYGALRWLALASRAGIGLGYNFPAVGQFQCDQIISEITRRQLTAHFELALFLPAQVSRGIEGFAQFPGIALEQAVEVQLDDGFNGGTALLHGLTPVRVTRLERLGSDRSGASDKQALATQEYFKERSGFCPATPE